MTGEAWFAVLADGERSRPAAQALRPLAARTIEHASGRPWLLGNWPDGRVTVAAAGAARLAVIGLCPVTAGALAERLAGVRGPEDVEAAAAGLTGSFHLAASVGGRVRVRGSASGVRRLFHAEVAGVTVAADRADTLAALTGAGVDERVLALHLLSSPPPYPLDTLCVWRGVTALPPQDCLLIEGDGQARARHWWDPPEPWLTAAEGAPALRSALIAAVGARTAGVPALSCDLSGGLDSTSVCFLAAAALAPADARARGAHLPRPRLVALTWEGRDPANDDAAWAGRAAAHLPHAEHVVPRRTQQPLWYAGLAGMEVPTDEPGPWVRDRAALAATARLMTRRGSRLHLTGAGADELFTAFPAHLHDDVRVRPLATLARLYRQHTHQPWPLWPVLRGLTDRRDFDRWLADWAGGLARRPSPPPRGRPRPCVAWGEELRMPVWATPEAVRAVVGLLREAADARPLPLAAGRGQHTALAHARASGLRVRQLQQVLAPLGLECSAPYLDDGVLEAALAVRPDERGGDGRYKPVLKEAMAGIVPGSLLRRDTKGEYSADLLTGLRRNRPALLALFEDSRLAGAGLVDADALRSRLTSLHAPGPDVLRGLDPTLGCETWLRDRAGGGPATSGGAPCPFP
ncbi:asparagine synthase-related protein [Streptomyces sp. NPDC049555]|uniref:asparagine synthase-related protein n=1 Tax=Streptomyces sp. NPDC049555 TaxID=3154930 RepID=UPI00342CF99B